MKKILIGLLMGIILLSFSSCKYEDLGQQNYNLKDALKISAIVFDEDSGEDDFVRDSLNNFAYNMDENIYVLEQLKLNEAKLMCPISTFYLNLSIHIEFDSIIEIISENEDVLIIATPANLLEPKTFSNSKDYNGFEIKFPFEGYIAINPLGSHCGHFASDGLIAFLPYSVDREYYLTINAYKFDNEETPIIRAQLKLVQLEDKTPNGHANQTSACYSIELVSYEYSDVYKIMEDAMEEEDE